LNGDGLNHAPTIGFQSGLDDVVLEIRLKVAGDICDIYADDWCMEQR
jgi:hypothetical protein